MLIKFGVLSKGSFFFFFWHEFSLLWTVELKIHLYLLNIMVNHIDSHSRLFWRFEAVFPRPCFSLTSTVDYPELKGYRLVDLMQPGAQTCQETYLKESLKESSRNYRFQFEIGRKGNLTGNQIYSAAMFRLCDWISNSVVDLEIVVHFLFLAVITRFLKNKLDQLYCSRNQINWKEFQNNQIVVCLL